MAENIVDLQVNTSTLISGAKAAKVQITGLIALTDELGQSIEDAFSIGGYKDYLKTVRRFGKGLTDELLVMQLSFGKMKSAIADACAPIVAHFVPMVNTAISAVTRFAGYMGQFFRGVLTGITGRDALAESANQAAEAEDGLAESAKKSATAVRRSLMAFDEINRLNGGSGGRSSSNTVETLEPAQLPEIAPQVQALVDRVLTLLRPLLEIDLTALLQALRNLWEHFQNLAAVAGQALEALWFQVLTPFIAWLAESFAPTLVNAFAAQLDMVTAALQPLMAGISALWQALKPVVSYIGASVLSAIRAWQGAFESLAGVFREKSPQITGILQNIASTLSVVWSRVGPVLSTMTSHFQGAFNQITSIVSGAVGRVIDLLYQITGAVSGVFAGDWAAAWAMIRGILVGVVNGVIADINYMLNAIGSALNTMISGANSMSITIPSWVPVIGGRSYSPSLSYVNIPQIPLLAKGAVLPANQPFLAMVGDQKHGTNVEAPLATIQEAVAVVMEDVLAGNMAGFNATVDVLGQILQAVLGIHVGDDMIAAAAARQSAKIALMKGV